MLRISNEKSKELPPNVFGRNRGEIYLEIEEIRWKSKVYPAVEIRIKWWGDDLGAKINVNRSNCNKNGSIAKICYKINTHYELFKSYLQNSDPIEIQVFSLKTNTLIASTKTELPTKLKNFSRLGEDCIVKTNSQITSSRFFCLGDLILSFKLHYFLNQNMTKPIKPLVLKTQAEQEIPYSKVVNKEITVIKPVSRCKENVHKKVEFEPTFSNTVSPTSYTELNSTKKLSILSYLSGERMHRDDESKILKEIVSISPASSIIEALDKISPKNEHEKLCEMVDSIRIFLSVFKSSSAGGIELQHLNNGDKMMSIICLVSSTLFAKKERIKITSLPQEDYISDAIFNAEVINRISLPEISSRAESEVLFNFYLKAFGEEFGRYEAIFVGSAQVKLNEMINRKFGCSKKCPIKNDRGLIIASINIKLELGSKGIHFGEKLVHAYSGDKENQTILSDDDSDIFVRDHCKKFKKPAYRSRPTTSNDDSTIEKSSESKVTQTDPLADSPSTNNSNSSNSRVHDESKKNGDKLMVDQEKPVAPSIDNVKILSGLLFVEQMRISKETPQSEYFINYDGFWNGCLETTKTCAAGSLNHLKSFVTVCNDTFLKKVQNSQLVLKLWEKTNGLPEKLIAVTKLPLHQFYIAFRDVVMIEHLSSNVLPVISIDGWTNLVSPLSIEYYGQMKVLLAVGNQNQIDYLTLSRNLVALSMQQPPANIPLVHKEMETQTNGNRDQIKDKLSAFIANLGNKQATPIIDSFGESPINSVFKQPSLPISNISSTSYLLDNLQQALKKPLTDDGTFVAPPAPFEFTPQPNEISTSAIQVDGLETFRILIDIEEAIHLPKIMVHKKHNRNRKKPGHQQLGNEIEPSAYATFDAALASTLNDETKHLLPPNIVKSHEGYVYTTNVVERSSTPKWNKTFDVTLPVDMMINPEKRFILKVWRKLTHDLPQCRLSPSPLEDAVVGFTAIDLSIFLLGMQNISGWYNIMDFSSRVNGQIKVNLKPLESVAKYRQPLPLLSQLNVDTGSNDPNSPSSILGRTLKRKFTELEEITQRLKARLFDVTGDENFDPDDEFERDLNTTVDEMEDDEFEWFKGTQNGLGFNEQANQFQSVLTTNPTNSVSSSHPQPSTSSQCHAPSKQIRAVSGCSQQQQNELSLENLLKQYDLDTIINPNIFKNLMDPTIATSESTPNLHENPVDNACLIDLDESSSAISDLSNDQVQNIQNALQNASINEQSRPVPEGSNNSRKE